MTGRARLAAAAAGALGIALAAGVPSLLLASGGEAHGGGGINWHRFGGETPPLVASFVNLAIMLFILWYFARKPVAGFFAERSRRIRAAVEESARVARESEERFRAIQEKLANVEEEMQAARRDMIAMAAAEKEQATARGHAQAEAIREGALKLIAQEKEAVIDAVRRELAARVIDRAEAILRATVGPAEQQRIVRRTIDTLAGGL